MAIGKNELIRAIELAQAGRWEDSHKIVQRDDQDDIACWLHAVLHKIEGDADNARYWYRRTTHTFEEFPDATIELQQIARRLT